VSKLTLFACETPWTDPNGKLVTWSMRGMLGELCGRLDVRLLYRTFSTGDELVNLLDLEVPVYDRTIVYVGSHGRGGRLVTRSGLGINLATIAKARHPRIEGVWLSGCDVGGAAALPDILKGGGPSWAGGYTNNVSWDAAPLLDLAILQCVLANARPKDKKTAVRLMSKALQSFAPLWNIGYDGVDVPLREGFRVVARNLTNGPTAEDVTDSIRDKLGWAESRNVSRCASGPVVSHLR
jgi:hypothetical protein